MSVVGGLRSALRDNIKAGTRWGNVSPYFHPNPSPPMIHMWPSEPIVYHGAMAKGKQDYTFTVQAMVDWTEDAASQMLLDKLYDPTGIDSLITCIESDRTLGGLCDTLQVTQAGGYQVLLTQANEARLTADWTVIVTV